MTRVLPFLLGLMIGGVSVALFHGSPPPRASVEIDESPLLQAQAAAEARVRGTRGGNETRFRGMQAYRQAVPGTVAVCGQTNLAEGQNFIPFIAVTTLTDGRSEVDLYLARTSTEATRVYAESVARCFEGGGPVPRPGGAPSPPPNVPPLPNGLGDIIAARPPAASEAPLAAPPPGQDVPVAQLPPVPSAREARPGVAFVVQSNANLRAEPSGGAAVLRVARPGTSFRVFGEAPGGWYQVGTTAPEGWIHGSLGAVQ